MPQSPPIDALPLWAVFLVAIGLIAIGHEFGHRLGKFRTGSNDPESASQVGGMVAAELGLLAFLLAFTFGLAGTRFDVRRQVLLDEANAIGTAYLRAGMLPAEHRAEARRLLKEYVGIRISGAQGHSLAHAIKESENLHARLWDQAVLAAEKDPRSVPTGLFIEALNEVIDLHSKRVTAGLRSRIPTTVWVVLFAVAILSFAAMGYQGGLTGKARSPAVVVVALTFATVIWLVADLDRPGQGLLRVSQQPMIDLRNSMEVGSTP
jgi:hypothetical protein